MKKSILIFILLGFFFQIKGIAQKNCHVTYIGNEGFMVEIQGKKIVCDALFGHIRGNWCEQPDSATLEKLISGQPPFHAIDLVSISHKHSDHFNKEMVTRFMQHHPETKVICPAQVKAELTNGSDDSSIQHNLITVTPDILSDSVLTVAGIGIRVLRLEHSHYMETDPQTGKQKNRHADIENLGYVFNINGYKIFHCGDTNPFNEKEYRTFALQKESIRLAFLDRMFMGGKEQSGFKTIQNYIQPGQIILMHLDPSRKEMFKSFTAQLKGILPDIYIFDQIMERHSY